MVIIEYLRIIGRYWWIIVLAVAAAVGGASAYDLVRNPEYSGSATVALLPSSQTLSNPAIDSRTLVDLIGQLGVRSVLGTYAQAFTTKEVVAAAGHQAGMSAADTDRYPLQANVLPDTVVIQVSGKGPDPNILKKYMDATVSTVVSSTHSLFAVVALAPLEPASVPGSPSSPQPTRDIPLAVALGLVLGIIMAMLLQYLRNWREVETHRMRLPHDTAPLQRTPPELNQES